MRHRHTQLVLEGYFPDTNINAWPQCTENSRQKYNELRKEFIIDPTTGEQETTIINHPLSLDEQSPWTKYFQDSELRKIIQQDVERTYTDIEYFRDKRTRAMMTDILVVYCKMNEDISYRQGMHELLALLLWAVEVDAIDKEEKEEIVEENESAKEKKEEHKEEKEKEDEKNEEEQNEEEQNEEKDVVEKEEVEKKKEEEEGKKEEEEETNVEEKKEEEEEKKVEEEEMKVEEKREEEGEEKKIEEEKKREEEE